jgi:hypothetical protein
MADKPVAPVSATPATPVAPAAPAINIDLPAACAAMDSAVSRFVDIFGSCAKPTIRRRLKKLKKSAAE